MAKKKTAQSRKGVDYKVPEESSNGVAGKPQDEFSRIAANLPKDAQQKLEEIKKSLDKFKEQLLKKFDKYVIGIALLPPKLTEEQIAALPPEVQSAVAQQQPAQHVTLQQQAQMRMPPARSEERRVGKECRSR